MSKFNEGMRSSNRQDWGTPWWLYNLLDDEFSFTLDACATADNAKHENYFSPEEDGLTRPWTGRVFMNPPYGRQIQNWVGKAHESARKGGAIVVCLVAARTDTRWWWKYVRWGEVRFIQGRIKFDDGTDNPQSAPFPSAVVIFRPGGHPSTSYWHIPKEERK